MEGLFSLKIYDCGLHSRSCLGVIVVVKEKRWRRRIDPVSFWGHPGETQYIWGFFL